MYVRLPLSDRANGIDGELQLLLDRRITAKIEEENWQTGDFAMPQQGSPEAKKMRLHNAVLRVVVGGNVLDAESLERPLARLKPMKLAGAPGYQLTVDYSAGFGSYSGPITSFVALQDRKLSWLTATDEKGGHPTKVSVMTSLKTVWKATNGSHGITEILQAACRPGAKNLGTGVDFSIIYTRYYFKQGKWLWAQRRVPGLSEFEDGFPKRSLFP